MDHVSIESLRAKADICSMEERYENLLTEYYEKCLINNNPLMSDSAGLIKSKKRISSEERIPESTKNHDAKFSH